MAVTTDRAAVQPRRRDQHARTTLEAAYAEHAPRLVRLAFLLTGDSRLAEDLTNEAFVRAFARVSGGAKPKAPTCGARS